MEQCLVIYPLVISIEMTIGFCLRGMSTITSNLAFRKGYEPTEKLRLSNKRTRLDNKNKRNSVQKLCILFYETGTRTPKMVN